MKEYLIIPIMEICSSLKALFCYLTHSIYGLLIGIVAYLCTIIAPVQELMIFTFFLVVVDWVLAFTNALKTKTIDSKKRWKLATKTIAYSILFVICGGIIKFVPLLESLVDLILAIIVLLEFWSILANMKILFPNMKILSFLETMLQHEINRKLGKEDSETIEIEK